MFRSFVSFFFFSSLALPSNIHQPSYLGAVTHIASEVSLDYSQTPVAWVHTTLPAKTGTRYCVNHTLSTISQLDPAVHTLELSSAFPLCVPACACV